MIEMYMLMDVGDFLKKSIKALVSFFLFQL